MRHMIIFLFLLLVMLPHPAMAVLCLGLSVENVPSVTTFQGGSGGYSSYDEEEHLQTVNFRVRDNAITADCDYYVTLSAGQSGNFSQRHLAQGADILRYNAYLAADKSDILNTDSNVIVGHFSVLNGLNQVNDHSFVWTVDPLQAAPASSMFYKDATELTLNSGLLLGVHQFVSPSPITFQARVESSVDLSLVDAGAPFDIGDTTQLIDFGVLESGEQKGFDIIIRSNDGYSVTMQSLHGQSLAHANAPAVADVIDYTVTLNSAAVDLSSGAPVEVVSGSEATPPAGTRFPIDLTIGTLTGKETAGTYSDIISVDVTAN